MSDYGTISIRKERVRQFKLEAMQRGFSVIAAAEAALDLWVKTIPPIGKLSKKLKLTKPQLPEK